MTIGVGISQKKNIKNFDHVQILWNDPYAFYLCSTSPTFSYWSSTFRSLFLEYRSFWQKNGFLIKFHSFANFHWDFYLNLNKYKFTHSWYKVDIECCWGMAWKLLCATQKIQSFTPPTLEFSLEGPFDVLLEVITEVALALEFMSYLNIESMPTKNPPWIKDHVLLALNKVSHQVALILISYLNTKYPLKIPCPLKPFLKSPQRPFWLPLLNILSWMSSWMSRSMGHGSTGPGLLYFRHLWILTLHCSG